MKTAEFLSYLRHQHVELWADGDRLAVKAPKGVLTAELQRDLSRRKPEILSFLNKISERLAPSTSAAGRLASRIEPVPASSRLPRPPGAERAAPLSFAQQRLWVIDQLEPGSPAYNLPVAVRVRGALNPPLLRRVINELVRRHESLRTSFREIDGRALQVVFPAEAPPMSEVDLRGLAESRSSAELERQTRREVLRPFDLARPPLLRLLLVRLKHAGWAVVATMHHIVSDGWSMGIFIRELTGWYESIVAGAPSPLASLGVQYADFSHWQRQRLRGEVLEAELSYWRQALAGAPARLELPMDRPLPKVQSFRGAGCAFRLPRAITDSLRRLSQSQDITLYMALLGGLQALLGRLTVGLDILVGSPVAGRTQVEVEGLIGFFVNTLVLRTSLSGDPSFHQLLARVRTVTLEAYTHQELPFERLVEELEPDRNLSTSPIFQVMFAYQSSLWGRIEMGELQVEPLVLEPSTAKFELTMALEDSGEDLVGMLEYRTDLFDATTMGRFLRHFAGFLSSLASHPERRLSEQVVLFPEEIHELLVEANDTRSLSPVERTIPQIFAQVAARHRDSVAVLWRDRGLSYRELDLWSDRLAFELRSFGVTTEVAVGVCLERSAEVVVAILAVLKAGGVYVPLDPSYPAERLSFMMSDVGAELVITVAELTDVLPAVNARVLYLDAEASRPGAVPFFPTEPAAPSTSLAYVMYTSGSTGRPKGVAIAHRSVVRLVRENDFAALSSQEVFLLFAPISFDASTLEIWGPLLNGGRLVVFPEGPVGVEELGEVIERAKVTTLWLTAGLFHRMVDGSLRSLGALRQLLAGGDVLSPPRVDRVLRGLASTVLINGYGPTENTTFTCCYRASLPLFGSVPIGRPISNTRVYLLDGNFSSVPIGVAGELYTGGDGLARGYVDRPGLTARCFVPDPFGAGGRLYRTGDLVRWQKKGTIGFLGRIDQQVKVRGFRIEPGEIESALVRHSAVGGAAVVVRRRGDGDKRLVAYVVASESAVSAKNLRAELRRSLPAHMIPSAFVYLSALPLSPNGKVDRHKLPEPGVSPSRDAVRTPRTPVEEVLADIWAQVLDLPEVGLDDNFFEVGGHSLLAMQVISRARRTLGVEIGLRTLFETPTLAGLAAFLERLKRGEGRDEAPPLVRVPREGRFPLSFAQQRLWFIDQLEPDSAAYNIPLALSLRGELNVPALIHSFGELARRHETLRTVFVSAEPEPIQLIRPPERVPLPIVDLERLAEAARERQVHQLVVAESQKPFDLARGPLLRLGLLRLREQDHIILVTLHHIIGDGWSMGVLTRELGILYEAASRERPAPLPELPIQYADFSIWQRSWLSGERLAVEIDYWRERLRGLPPALELPADRSRPALRSSRGAVVSFEVPPGLSEHLKALAGRAGATLFMTLLAAFETLLYRTSGERDFAVGSPIAGRHRLEIENLIGLFVNTLVLRAELVGSSADRDPPFRALLNRVRGTTLEAYAYQDLPFEKLVEELHPERSLRHPPLYQIMFQLQNLPRAATRWRALEVAPWDGSLPFATKLDLSLAMEESTTALMGNLGYCTDLFDPATAIRMVRQFVVLLENVAEDPDRRLSQLILLTAAERQQLWLEWNDTSRNEPAELLLHQLFEARVDEQPDALAVLDGDVQLTYRQLDRLANRLARCLRRRGGGPEVPVGICLERSVDAVVAILGVLKSGSAYVPLDPSYPKKRLAFIIKNVGVRLLVTCERLLRALPAALFEPICWNTHHTEILGESSERLKSEATPENLAYVFYTSGSTGQPKGVAGLHRGAVNYLLRYMAVHWGLSSTDTVLQQASLSFDASVRDLVGSLAMGARVILPGEGAADPRTILAAIRDRRVSCCLAIVPTLLGAVLEAVRADRIRSRLRLILVSGEPFPLAYVQRGRKIFGESVEVVNQYGLTECTATSTFQPLSGLYAEQGTGPLGRPIANTQLEVLDGGLMPSPIVTPGEVYIGGAGLARGYLARPRKTAACFIPDPFPNRAAGRHQGGRLYKTGDVARRLPDGDLEFLGRIDHQVKVRGLRIELKEIEAVLTEHPAVRKTVATVRSIAAQGETSADQRLVAFVVTEGKPAYSELQAFLEERIPRHMMPSVFVRMDAFPTRPNGKVDRALLSRQVLPELGQSRARFQEPRDRLELELARLWEELLDVRPVSVRSDFFHLGGHSLLATRLLTRIERRFEISISLAAFFQRPTVEGLAALVHGDLEPGPEPALVALKSEGSGRPPLFWVHPVGGNVLCYAELARHLGKDQPFYAFQSLGLDGQQALLPSVEAMAAHYVGELRAVQSAGSYRLGGWSAGGVIAFEMARQLQERGDEVALLTLLDTRAPSPEQEPEDDQALLASFAYDLGLPLEELSKAQEILEMAPADQVAFFLEKAISSGLLQPDVGPERVLHLFEVFKTNSRARARYEPSPWDGELILFKASSPTWSVARSDPTLGWGEWALGGVRELTVPGDHYTILQKPGVEILAHALTDCLKEVDPLQRHAS